MSQATRLIRLIDLPLDCPARLVQIQAGRQLARRLLALGLRQGSLLQVIQRRGRGLVVASGALRIAIGMGIADKLWVSLESEPSEIQPTGLAQGSTGSQPTGIVQPWDLEQ